MTEPEGDTWLSEADLNWRPDIPHQKLDWRELKRLWDYTASLVRYREVFFSGLPGVASRVFNEKQNGVFWGAYEDLMKASYSMLGMSADPLTPTWHKWILPFWHRFLKAMNSRLGVALTIFWFVVPGSLICLALIIVFDLPLWARFILAFTMTPLAFIPLLLLASLNEGRRHEMNYRPPHWRRELWYRMLAWELGSWYWRIQEKAGTKPSSTFEGTPYFEFNPDSLLARLPTVIEPEIDDPRHATTQERDLMARWLRSRGRTLSSDAWGQFLRYRPHFTSLPADVVWGGRH